MVICGGRRFHSNKIWNENIYVVGKATSQNFESQWSFFILPQLFLVKLKDIMLANASTIKILICMTFIFHK